MLCFPYMACSKKNNTRTHWHKNEKEKKQSGGSFLRTLLQKGDPGSHVGLATLLFQLFDLGGISSEQGRVLLAGPGLS